MESTTSNIRHTIVNSDRSKPGATIESLISNTRYTIANSDRSKPGATRENLISNTRYTIRDSDRGKPSATRESTTSNARYIITIFIINNRFRNDHAAWQIGIKSITTPQRVLIFIRNFYIIWSKSIVCNVVAQSVHLEIVGRKPYGYR